MPTSLIYIVLSTRGCSPWRPAAVMSTTWRESHSLRWIFKGRRGRSGPRRGAGLYRPWDPSSGQTDFRVMGRQEEKRTLPGTPADVSTFGCVAAENSASRRRNVNRLPFRGAARSGARVHSGFPCPLGSADPRPTAVHVEPFPTSVLKVLV